MSTESGVTLIMTRDEALVFFEWLSREDEKSSLPLEHQAEQKVLWTIEAQLERLLVEPLRPDYAELVSAARQRLVSGQE